MACIGGTREDPKIWWRYRRARQDEIAPNPDGLVFERVDGRICDRMQPRTSRVKCGPCPAYRGLRWAIPPERQKRAPRGGARIRGLAAREGVLDPQPANGLVNGVGDPYGLSASEHEQYQGTFVGMSEDELMEWLLEDHDDEAPPEAGQDLELYALFLERMSRTYEERDGRRVVKVGMGARALRSPEQEGTELHATAKAMHAADMRQWRAEHPGEDKRKRDRAAYMREYRRRRRVDA